MHSLKSTLPVKFIDAIIVASAAIAVALILALGTTNFAPRRHMTWTCYNEQSQSLGGVLVVFIYSLAHAPTYEVEPKFSAADGTVLLADHPQWNPKAGGGGVFFVYSAQMHAGWKGSGESYLPNEPIPSTPVYSPYTADGQYSRQIYFRDAREDPIKWHQSLHLLLDCLRRVKHPEFGSLGVGVEALENTLVSLARTEREQFLAKYGNTNIPTDYSKYQRRPVFSGILPEIENGTTFADITLPLP